MRRAAPRPLIRMQEAEAPEPEAGAAAADTTSAAEKWASRQEPAAAAPAAAPVPAPVVAAVDQAELDFEERLAMLASQIPASVPDAKDQYKTENIEKGQDESWISPSFYALCKQDLDEISWPARKQVFQTLYTSQIAFFVIVVLTLLFDSTIESAVRTLLLGEPFRITMNQIMKVKEATGQ